MSYSHKPNNTTYFVIMIYSKGSLIFKSTPKSISDWNKLTLKKKIELIYKTCFLKMLFINDSVIIQEFNYKDVPVRNLLIS
jgi:hypothetical protein